MKRFLLLAGVLFQMVSAAAGHAFLTKDVISLSETGVATFNQTLEYSEMDEKGFPVFTDASERIRLAVARDPGTDEAMGWSVSIDILDTDVFVQVYTIERLEDPFNIAAAEWTLLNELFEEPTLTLTSSESDEVLPATDPDNNGTRDADERGDGDGNGTRDSLERHVTSLKAYESEEYISVSNTPEYYFVFAEAQEAATTKPHPPGISLTHEVVETTLVNEEAIEEVEIQYHVERDTRINGVALYNQETEEFESVAATVEHGEYKTVVTFILAQSGAYNTTARSGPANRVLAPAGDNTVTFVGGPAIIAAATVPSVPPAVAGVFALLLGAVGLFVRRKRA